MEPIYDEKVIQILEMLEQGLSREEVAEHFRYASYRSMDEYMRRKNFRWDRREKMYVEANAERKPYMPTTTFFPSEKVRRIVREFEKEAANPREIAKKLGFENHFEMANYMTSKGFEWSNEAENYVSASAEPPHSIPDDSTVDTDATLQNTNVDSKGTQYLSLLQWLSENKDSLQHLIEASVASNASGKIPRFTLPGLFVTKSVHMKNTLDQMVRDFSQEKNINQREIFEVALIEFFQKYGFQREVQTLLESNG